MWDLDKSVQATECRAHPGSYSIPLQRRHIISYVLSTEHLPPHSRRITGTWNRKRYRGVKRNCRWASWFRKCRPCQWQRRQRQRRPHPSCVSSRLWLFVFMCCSLAPRLPLIHQIETCTCISERKQGWKATPHSVLRSRRILRDYSFGISFLLAASSCPWVSKGFCSFSLCFFFSMLKPSRYILIRDVAPFILFLW